MITDAYPQLLRERAACGIGFIVHLSGRPSHTLVRDAISTLNRLAHRGAIASDGKTGDGAGILTQLPYAFFAGELEDREIGAPAPGDLGVGFFFLPQDTSLRQRAKKIVESVLSKRGLPLLTWRAVPIHLDALGEHARRTSPSFQHALIARPSHMDAGGAFERTLYLARKDAERIAREQSISPFYVASMSARTIVYKGLFVAPQLARFYLDLNDPAYESAIAVFHQRYSTNTFPTWERAQPFRFLCHNGEINTIQGNVAWMRAREPYLASPMWKDDANAERLAPIIDTDGSDSAMLDNAIELLTLSGRDIPHAQMMLIPEAWENVQDISKEWQAFYRFNSTVMEPWDGPAAVAYSDGRVVGMALDRNGLRPARYTLTDDGLIVAASESGALDIDPARIIEKGKLGPGQTIVADLTRGKFWHNDELKNFYATQKPYKKWLGAEMKSLPSPLPSPYKGEGVNVARQQAMFGYTDEELTVVLKPMATGGAEPTGSMGDDTPHAVLSGFDRPLYHYFKQRFAEVTNPPLDSLRETMVMSLRVLLGARGNVLDETPALAHLLELPSPFLTRPQLDAIRAMDDEFPHAMLSATFAVNDDPGSLEHAIASLCSQAERAVNAGNVILILSDRVNEPTRAPIPMLLAVGAVHQHLVRVGKRWRTSILAEVGDARDVHQLACLFGFGADAINPYLALASVRTFTAHKFKRDDAPANVETLSPARAEENYIHAAEKGLLKIMAKMGIATLDAYRGAQVFEIVGLANQVVEKCFTGTPSHISGVAFADIARLVLVHHAYAFDREEDAQLYLKNYGFFKYKKEGEYHSFNPAVVNALHSAVKIPGALDGNFPDAFNKYRDFVAKAHEFAYADLSDHLDILFGEPISISQVEPASEIVKRFSAAAMSHGALSIEAHKAIAVAMNRLGTMSNSGEGGEDPSRYQTESNSRIKQVASGRFGVTPAYLTFVDELQIKIAQGAKPGEGGQLPANKVTAEIAAIRYTTPGTAQISPPPHHDIYSIEDLAQLIYDLKRINPRAKVSVKLVAQAGVGTIAAGVAKAYADVVQISGHSGGTGASPLSSMKHAGIAWELGLAETQQVLVANDLRGRVRVRVDGGFKTARHVIVGALLGADEFSFGTTIMVAGGCVMARACHTNTCPAGIATQREDLRKKFPNEPERIMAYMLFLAEETREYLAAMGARSIYEIIGRVDRLQFNPRATGTRGTFANDVPAQSEARWQVVNSALVVNG